MVHTASIINLTESRLTSRNYYCNNYNIETKISKCSYKNNNNNIKIKLNKKKINN
jgi:hypothetical protein